ncbi:Scr1 family TA system antitoxin-like transcriptional regulator [Streptomyces sp. NBC_00659]|uniref:Scr1 family TA system antitoxin-like transcriptional regulator n=1 Tax=Streptomyces sp. NBC_00659 TaxID=2903669 RepID=UPI002E37B688|nr:Scr1 family TA system antitoxin-like transcriptional regulator [Streptomyces sp. NBC_00659]
MADRIAARAQLEEILLQSERSNVTVRVVPFDVDGFAGAHSSMLYTGGPVPQLDTAKRDAPHGGPWRRVCGSRPARGHIAAPRER